MIKEICCKTCKRYDDVYTCGYSYECLKRYEKIYYKHPEYPNLDIRYRYYKYPHWIPKDVSINDVTFTDEDFEL